MRCTWFLRLSRRRVRLKGGQGIPLHFCEERGLTGGDGMEWVLVLALDKILGLRLRLRLRLRLMVGGWSMG